MRGGVIEPTLLMKKSYGDYFFHWVISLGRVVLPSPKIVINLPRTNEKVHCKGETYWFSGWQTYIQT